MEKQLKQVSSLDVRQGCNRIRPKKGGKDLAKTTNEPKREIKAIMENGWFALVDTEKKSIVYVDSDDEQVKEFLKDVILPAKGEEWLEAHPEHNSPLVSAAVYESMTERFVIVKCSVNLASDGVVWTGDSEKTEVVLIGTTTLRRMLKAVYDENDPIHDRWYYSECMGAHVDFEKDPSIGDDVVYVYYHPEENETIFTNVKGDYWGFAGSSAGFKGKVTMPELTE